MRIPRGNIYADLPDCSTAEQFEGLLTGKGYRIERIVSAGQTTPPEQWYDQSEDEWVLLIQGSATLQFEDAEHDMQSGDHIFIPAHCRHQVSRTSSEPPCIWLAIHIDPALQR